MNFEEKSKNSKLRQLKYQSVAIRIFRNSCMILGSHSGGHEEIILWDITPSSPVRVNGLHGVISQKIELFKYEVPTAQKTLGVFIIN
jgi:hypothetical protein